MSTPPIAVYTPTSNLDPHAFSISPDGCTMYIAIGSLNTSQRSVAKFTKTAGVWAYNYRYNSTDNGVGLVVDYSQTNQL